MKTSSEGQVIGIPISSITYPLDQRSPKALLTCSDTQYHTDQSPDGRSSALRKSRLDSVLSRMNRLGKKADSFAHGIKNQARMGPNITNTVRSKLTFGARILLFGKDEKIFKQLFSVREGEKLLKASRCYLSTTAGPISGVLFISTDKTAFCSQKAIQVSSPYGELMKAHYKVVIPVSKIKRVDQSENENKPSQKYIEIVTVDNFDFWFMGFMNYQKALRYLQLTVLKPKRNLEPTKNL